eukprot:TRINITY_DN31735_c0_g1_i1.p1 TRINITY_DN31735_c0_g1~~TRINITY_DN31735_c0_g1_i1.p1  ORF type:complete len:566 (+),score=119.24 TRINITY_DN31735_c0_g1_i1:138-1835(+)
MSWIGFLVTAAVAVGLSVGASFFDLGFNPHGYSRQWRLRRWANWFCCGITYAGFYMGRYNMSVINNAETLGAIGVSGEEFGHIISIGFWGYAAAVLVTSPFCDMLGGRRSYILGTVLSGLLNLGFGVAFYLGPASKAMLIAFVLLNYFGQAIGTNVASKIGAGWYSKAERGTFSGVFGVMVSCGYYLAFALNGMLIEPGWPLVFIIPGCFILASALLLVAVVRDEPLDRQYMSSLSTRPSLDESRAALLRSTEMQEFTPDASGAAVLSESVPVPEPVAPKEVASAGKKTAALRLDFWEMVRLLWTAEFGFCCAALCCVGFVRETLLSWFTPFLGDEYAIYPGSLWYTISGTSIMIFGSMGALLCGYMSDRFFQSARPPAIMIFLAVSVLSFLVMYFVPIGPLASVMIGFTCLWVFGAIQSLNFTVAMDIGGPKVAATATGILGFFQYLGAGAGSVSMATIITNWGYVAWAITLPVVSALAVLFMGLLMLSQRHAERRQPAPVVEERVPVQDVSDVEPPTRASTDRLRTIEQRKGPKKEKPEPLEQPEDVSKEMPLLPTQPVVVHF